MLLVILKCKCIRRKITKNQNKTKKLSLSGSCIKSLKNHELINIGTI